MDRRQRNRVAALEAEAAELRAKLATAQSAFEALDRAPEVNAPAGPPTTVREAILALPWPGKPEHWTGNSKPQCDALGELLDREVGADERDAAWTELVAEAAAG